MIGNLKRVFLFVGMVVGAGFATGRELMLYFYGKSIYTLIMTGVLMGCAFALFLFVGGKSCYQYMKNTPIGKVVSSVMALSVIASFVVMTAGAEELLYNIFGRHYIGVFLGIICAFISTRTMNGIKNINLVIVPLLLVLVLFVTYGNYSIVSGRTSVYTAIKYVGMNMLMAGYLILEEGEKIRGRDIMVSSIIVSIIFTIILCVLVSGIWVHHKVSMPLYTLSLDKGLRYTGGVMILLSIVSTLIGDAKLIYDNTYNLVGNSSLSLAFIMLIAILSMLVDFASAVDIVYSIEGVIGIAFFVYIIVIYFAHSKKTLDISLS